MKSRFARSILAAATIALLSLGGNDVIAQSSVPVAAAEGGRLWFVELAGKPVADGNSKSAVQAEKAAFRQAAAAAGVSYVERRAFDTLFNGFSVEVNLRDRAKLAEIPGVKAIYPVEVIQAPTPERLSGGAAPDLANAIAMTGANVAQTTLGLTGAGVKVAIMDTGIDIDHPDFGGSGTNGATAFPSARIAYGYDLVGDAFNADPSSASYNPAPTPDPNPDDCGGHGTHVAGIVGANGVVKGVAPGVTFGAYRVFGCSGSTTADIMISAMEMALADGMHVLNMSIGSAFQWPQYPTAQAADRLVNKGMVVVASIGNSGANGIYSASAPGVGKKVIGVASFDNTHLTQPAFTANPGGLKIGYGTATGAPPPPPSGTLSLSATTPVTGCAAGDFAGFPAGNAALISRGGCTFHLKAANAQAAGAAAMVLYNNAPGTINPTVVGPVPITIPVVAITQADGLTLAGLASASITWGTETIVTVNPTGGLISSFSSYGLAPDLTLKPNIGAPGGGIYSTYPLESGRYATMSGTSMAAPHVAGSAALMLQAKPNTPSNGMKARMQNAADPKAWWGNPSLGFLDNVHRQGAGMLDVPGMVLATTVVEPSELSLGESEAGPQTRKLTIENKGPSAVTYNLSTVNALSTGSNTFAPSFFLGSASAAFSVAGAPASSIVVPANGSTTVDVTITPPAGPANGIYGGYVVLTDPATTPAQVVRVPFAGYVGDYQARQVLVPTASGFPWLAKLGGGFFSNQPAGATYSLVGDDSPFFLVHLDHQARRVRFEAFDADTGKAWHRISDDEYVGRNSTATGFFAFAWDGTTFTGKGKGKGKNGSQATTVPNGRYVVKLSVLKALGDDTNPAHWEIWTSPVITIARP